MMNDISSLNCLFYITTGKKFFLDLLSSISDLFKLPQKIIIGQRFQRAVLIVRRAAGTLLLLKAVLLGLSVGQVGVFLPRLDACRANIHRAVGFFDELARELIYLF